MARPKAFNFDDLVDKAELFGRFRATHKTIAEYFGCCTRTVEREFEKEDSEFCRLYKKALSNTKMTLAETQINLALDGNVPLLIWLGKQYLNQKDKVENSEEEQEKELNIKFEVVTNGSSTKDN